MKSSLIGPAATSRYGQMCAGGFATLPVPQSLRLSIPQSSSERLPAVDEQRHGAVVDQFDVHVRLEAAGFDLDPLPRHGGDEFLVESVGLCSTGGPEEAGARSLPTISQQRELTA